MKISENENSKFNKFLSGKGFYAVLAVCMIAIGVAGYLTVANLGGNKPEAKPQTSSLPQIHGGISKDSNIIEESKSTVDNKSESEPYESKTESENKEPKKPVANFFVLPVTGEVLKDFSNTTLQFSNTYGDMRIHAGVDIAPSSSPVVKSAGDGFVKEIIKSADYGNVVHIDHGNGITAKYCGLKNITVKKDAVVTQGQALGEIDVVPCECVDKAHLHFETFKDGKAISPFSLVDKVGE